MADFTLAILLVTILAVQISQCCHPCLIKNQFLDAFVPVSPPLKSCNETQLLHEESNSCHEYRHYSRERGPCGEGMSLFEDSTNPKLGKCECEINKFHPKVYVPKMKQCYPVFTQGPCQQGKWLEFKNGSLKCATNPCLNKGIVGTPVFYNGSCVALSSRCASGQVQFNEFFQLGCVPMRMAPLALGAIPPARCPPRQYKPFEGGRCQEVMYFDFD